MPLTYEVLPYSIDAISNLIGQITQTPFHHIKQKRQIKFLKSFVKGYDLNEKKLFIIVEHEYIEKHYLEDYVEYFAKCFQRYPKTCSRFHLFYDNSEDVDPESPQVPTKSKFRNALINNDSEFITSLIDNYYGYLVVRPIPSTVFAKVCLKPYPRLKDTVITRTYNISLFGIPLTVDTVAFQEQDKILSACATSSLWSLYNAHQCLSLKSVPSPNTITAEAVADSHDKNIHGGGLSTAMICRSMQKNGFIPKSIELGNDSGYKSMLEHIHAYCSSNIPLITGVTVYDNSDTEEKETNDLLGYHAMAVLGFGYSDEVKACSDNTSLNVKAHRINRIYVHDDRSGPFARLKLINTALSQITTDGKVLSVKQDIWSMKIKHTDGSGNYVHNELYKPHNLIFGTYHKVRIPYLSVKKTCVTLVNRLRIAFKREPSEGAFNPNLNIVDNLVWDIKIKNNNDLKNEILKSEASNKELLLTEHLPRYVWSASAELTSKTGDTRILFEMLFDATDIPQGNVFLDVIYHNPIGKALIEALRKDCKDFYFEIVNENTFNGLPREDHFWGLVQYFKKEKNYDEMLDEVFGELKYPKYIKPDEIEHDVIKDQKAILLFTNDDIEDFQLNPKHKYLWAINKDGGLLLGREDNIEDIESIYRGHTTLTQGYPARIAGELQHKADSKWVLNSQSGRYSSDYDAEERFRFMENVLKQKFYTIFEGYDIQLEVY